MKNILISVILFLLPCSGLGAQDVSDQDSDRLRNYLTVYGGLLEINLNYERNLLVFTTSYLNVRFGFGLWNNMKAEGDVYNISLVHLIGSKLMHLELNAGAKYIHGEIRNGHSIIYPDLFVGLRFERPESRFILRTGFSSLSIFNLGAGIKF